MPGNADPSPQQITYVNFIWKGILLLLLSIIIINLVAKVGDFILFLSSGFFM